MPSQPRPGNAKSYPIQWVHIDDFSPGCYSAGHISTESPINSAPLGSAYLPGTYACASIPGGALAPLPARTYDEPFSNNEGGIPGGAPYAIITGFIVTPQLNSSPGWEIVSIHEADNGTNHYITAVSHIPYGGATNVISGPTESAASVSGFYGSPYPAFTRVNTPGGAQPTQPVLVFPSALSTDAATNSGHMWMYPNPSSPTAFTALDLISSHSSVTGPVITYGNRVIAISGVAYPWPVGGTIGVNSNENFNYTDPPESTSFGFQQTVMAVEIPWGYGAWGTMSVGELLLIKKYGGAVILNGDINVPSSIIRIPGVQPIGDIIGRAAATHIGLVYCSQDRGAWVWNGGNTAQKISQNINDDFFDLQTNNVATTAYGFNVEPWQKWLMFSGNVMMDTETGGWWKLYPNRGTNPFGITGRDIWWYTLGRSGNLLVTAPLRVWSNTDAWYSIFDNTVPSNFYNWQSLPIHVTKDADRVIDVRQVVIRASDPTNTGNATIIAAVAGFTGTSNTRPVTIGINPTTIRFNVGSGAQGLQDISLNIYATNGGGASAPIIHSIDIGYIVRAGVSVAD